MSEGYKAKTNSPSPPGGGGGWGGGGSPFTLHFSLRMQMTFQTFIFWAFAVVLIGSAVGVIIARNPVHSALLLVLAFFTSAGLWIQLEAEFLAIALVLVYVGAGMVLFLFVVMMLDINLAKLREGFLSYLPLGGAVAALLVAGMGLFLWGHYTALGVEEPAPAAPGFSNTRQLGR